MTGPKDRLAVLVVEDEPLIRMAAVEAISELNAFPVEAGDADTAIQLLSPAIRVLFTDVNMPGRMDGLELAFEVRRRRPDIHIVVTSGKQTLAQQELPAGGIFLPKPYRFHQLQEVMGGGLGP